MLVACIIAVVIAILIGFIGAGIGNSYIQTEKENYQYYYENSAGETQEASYCYETRDSWVANYYIECSIENGKVKTNKYWKEPKDKK